MMPPDTCNLPNGAPTTAPLFGDLKPMRNCNGLLTSIKKDKKKVLRHKVISKYIAAKQAELVRLQEPHNLSNKDERKLAKALDSQGYHFWSNNNPEGRAGGVAFVWRHGLIMEHALSALVMMASFTNAEGLSMTAMCAHFSHIRTKKTSIVGS